MTTIYLIRHAEAEGNLYRIAQGQANSIITDRGWRQIQALERRFAGHPRGRGLCQRPLPHLRHGQRHLQAQGAAPAPAAGPAGDLRGRVGAKDLGRDRPGGPGAAARTSTSALHLWRVEGAETPQAVQDRLLAAVRRHRGGQRRERRWRCSPTAAPSGCCWRPFRGSPWRSWAGRPPAATPPCPCCGRRTGGWRWSGGTTCQPPDGPGLHPGRHGEKAGQRPGAGAVLRCRWTPEQAEHSRRPAPGAICRRRALDGAAGLVGYLGETPVGAVAFDDCREADRGRGWISLLAVAEPWRRRGYGVQLIGQAVLHYRPRGRDHLRLPPPETEAAAAVLPGVRLCPGRRRETPGKRTSDTIRSSWARDSAENPLGDWGIGKRPGRSKRSGPAVCGSVPGDGPDPGSDGRSCPRWRGPASTRWGPPPGPGPSGSPAGMPTAS